MLYRFYRYLIWLCASLMIGVSLAIIVFFSDPSGFSALGRTQSFGPILTLLYIFSLILSLSTIIFAHPFITDGEETLEMHTPISHAAVQGNIALIVMMSFLQVSAIEGNIDFFTQRIVEATSFILKVAVISLLTSCAEFYAIRRRARVKKRRGEETRAFCVESSFRGL